MKQDSFFDMDTRPQVDPLHESIGSHGEVEFSERRLSNSSSGASSYSVAGVKRTSEEGPRVPSRHVIIAMASDDEENLMEPVPEDRRLTLRFTEVKCPDCCCAVLKLPIPC